MALKLTNNASSTLAGSILSTDTELSVSSADAAKFPTLDEGDWFPLTIVDASGNMEIMKCTARTGATFTVTRAQEGTTAKNFLPGSVVDLRATAGILENLSDEVTTLSQNLSIALNGMVRFDEEQDLDNAEQAQVRSNIGITDGWATQPIGVPIPLFNHLDGVVEPPIDKSYRYIILSAGYTGTGSHNEGILTSESVSGSAPNITATAVIDDVNSPLDGVTVHLINTERRFIRPGSSGVLEDDQNLSHNHFVNDPGHNHHVNDPGHVHGTPTYRTTGGTVYFGGSGGNMGSAAGTYSATTGIWLNSAATGIWLNDDGGNEARPRNIGATYYMRIR